MIHVRVPFSRRLICVRCPANRYLMEQKRNSEATSEPTTTTTTKNVFDGFLEFKLYEPFEAAGLDAIADAPSQ